MAGLSFYTVDERYIDYLAPYAPHLVHNAKKGQGHSRKYIGIVLEVNGFEYFAPLSSFKEKHRRMKNGLDFIKVGDYAVINLNCMFPVATDTYQRVDFSAVQDKRYRDLLQAEYRIIKQLEGRIRKNASTLYNHKANNGDSTPLSARCNDFPLLERACQGFRYPTHG